MKKKIKICHLTSVHSPFDTRIFYKELKSLAKEQYEVVIIAQHDRKEIVEGITIIPLPTPKNRFERMTIVAGTLLLRALKEHACIYHFHDPELLPAGLLLKLFTRAAIFYDVHEDYPKLITDKDWIGKKLLRRIIAFLFESFERFTARLLDKIIAATSDIAQKFPHKKTVIIRNFVSLDIIDTVEPLNCSNEKTIVIYIGLLENNRGIKEIIQAMELVGDKAELWIIGRWETEQFQNECEHLKGWEHTHYFGHKKAVEAYGFLKAADIGLHCIYRNDYLLRGLPTKVFEYAACSLPVIISYSRYWEDLFGEFVVFTDPRNPEDIAQNIRLLINDDNMRKRLGEKARKFVEKTYNWESESIKLHEVYNNVLKGRVS